MQWNSKQLEQTKIIDHGIVTLVPSEYWTFGFGKLSCIHNSIVPQFTNKRNSDICNTWLLFSIFYISQVAVLHTGTGTYWSRMKKILSTSNPLDGEKKKWLWFRCVQHCKSELTIQINHVIHYITDIYQVMQILPSSKAAKSIQLICIS